VSSKDDNKERALIEAHMLICYTYQSLMKPPSETDGRYEDSMRVWNLKPEARGYMTAAERDLYDALMRTKA